MGGLALTRGVGVAGLQGCRAAGAALASSNGYDLILLCCRVVLAFGGESPSYLLLPTHIGYVGQCQLVRQAAQVFGLVFELSVLSIAFVSFLSSTSLARVTSCWSTKYLTFNELHCIHCLPDPSAHHATPVVEQIGQHVGQS